MAEAAFIARSPGWSTVIITLDGRIEYLAGADEWQEYVDLASPYQSADVEWRVVCATTAAGVASCWEHEPPIPDAPPDPTISVPEGVWHDVCLRQVGVPSYRTACALDESGYPTCWGADIGEDPPEMLSELSCGETHVCGLTLDNRIVCWGDCADGECDTPGAE